MDTLKKRGPKSKAEKAAAVTQALDTALARLAPLVAAKPDVQEVDGLPPHVAALDIDTNAPLAPAAPGPGEPERAEFVVDVPPHLHDSAIPLHDLLQCPADIRAAIQSQLGCLFDLSNGVLTARDGRGYTVRHVGHTIEVSRG